MTRWVRRSLQSRPARGHRVRRRASGFDISLRRRDDTEMRVAPVWRESQPHTPGFHAPPVSRDGLGGRSQDIGAAPRGRGLGDLAPSGARVSQGHRDPHPSPSTGRPATTHTTETDELDRPSRDRRSRPPVPTRSRLRPAGHAFHHPALAPRAARPPLDHPARLGWPPRHPPAGGRTRHGTGTTTPPSRVMRRGCCPWTVSVSGRVGVGARHFGPRRNPCLRPQSPNMG